MLWYFSLAPIRMENGLDSLAILRPERSDWTRLLIFAGLGSLGFMPSMR